MCHNCILKDRFQDMVSLVTAGNSPFFLVESIALFRKEFQGLEAYMEKRAAWVLLKSKSMGLSEVLGPIDDYEDLISQELYLARKKFNNPVNIAFAGAGALPISAILLAEKGGMKVTCIDMDPEAACLAGLVLNRFCKHLSVNYVLANATEFDYSGFDMVYVSSMSEPKDLILKRIRDTAVMAPVITRVPKKQFEIFCNLLTRECIEKSGYNVIETSKHPHTMHKSVCLAPANDKNATCI